MQSASRSIALVVAVNLPLTACIVPVSWASKASTCSVLHLYHQSQRGNGFQNHPCSSCLVVAMHHEVSLVTSLQAFGTYEGLPGFRNLEVGRTWHVQYEVDIINPPTMSSFYLHVQNVRVSSHKIKQPEQQPRRLQFMCTDRGYSSLMSRFRQCLLSAFI